MDLILGRPTNENKPILNSTSTLCRCVHETHVVRFYCANKSRQRYQSCHLYGLVECRTYRHRHHSAVNGTGALLLTPNKIQCHAAHYIAACVWVCVVMQMSLNLKLTLSFFRRDHNAQYSQLSIYDMRSVRAKLNPSHTLCSAIDLCKHQPLWLVYWWCVWAIESDRVCHTYACEWSFGELLGVTFELRVDKLGAMLCKRNANSTMNG